MAGRSGRRAFVDRIALHLAHPPLSGIEEYKATVILGRAVLEAAGIDLTGPPQAFRRLAAEMLRGRTELSFEVVKNFDLDTPAFRDTASQFHAEAPRGQVLRLSRAGCSSDPGA